MVYQCFYACSTLIKMHTTQALYIVICISCVDMRVFNVLIYPIADSALNFFYKLIVHCAARLMFFTAKLPFTLC